MADGSIIFEAKLDTSGIKKGLGDVKKEAGGLSSVLKKLGYTIGIAFSVGAIIQFGKTSVNAANELSAALTGLQSILDGQGRSFSAAKAFIEEYTKDGLIPATNAITAYKNLALRGYDDSQIRQVMIALKDSAAFGRQASYSMGEAVQSATEGLKNENSILVDNAGVTKNVAQMWKEYAASIGTTASNLTQQQKIQAEVNGILEESKYQVGDAAKVAGTLTGQITQLSFNFYNLKVAVGNAINPILQKFIPVINAAVQALTRFANAVATVIGAIFGKASVQSSALAAGNDAIASSAAAGTAAEKELADATKEAGEAAEKSLMPFDELNKLQDPSSGGGSIESPSGDFGGGLSMEISADAQVEDTISPKLQAIVDKVKELVEPLKNIDFGSAVAAFGRLKDAIAPFTEKLFAGLEWAWYNILVPLTEWTIEDLLPAFLNSLSEALGVLNTTIDTLKPLAQWLWDEFLKPIAEWTGGVIVDVLGSISNCLEKIGDWIKNNQKAVETIAIVAASFAAAWMLVNGALLIWNTIAGLATTLTTAFGTAVAFLTSPIFLVALAIAGLIAVAVLLIKNWEAVKLFFKDLWDKVAQWAVDAWAKVTGIWEDVTGWFDEHISSPIKKVWEDISAWFEENVKPKFTVEYWKGLFKSIAEGMKQKFKDGINEVIKLFNKFISWINEKMHINWEPIIDPIFGKTIIPGVNIQLFTIPNIPKLAKGAVIPPNREFMAVLGDQRNGTNVEAPLSTIQEAVSAAVNSQQQIDLLREQNRLLQQILERCGLTIDGQGFAKAVTDYQNRENWAMGW